MSGNKKRFLLLAAVLAIVLSFAVLATACGGGGGGNTPQKSLSGINATLADGSTLTFEDGYIVMQEGAVSAVAKGDFKVIATYSDGSQKTVTDFTVDASALTQSNGVAGTYSVIVSYKGMTATVSVLVKSTAKTALLPVNTTAEYKYEYTGQPIDVIAKLDENRTAENKLAAIISSGKATVSAQQGQNERTKTNAGFYGLCLNAADGYEWKDGETASDTLFISWQITKKVLALPTVDNVRSFEYTGSEITLPVDMKGNEAYVTLANGGETNKGTSVGSYTVQAMIKSNYQANYTFVVDGRETDGPVDIGTWTITKKTLVRPEITNARWIATKEGVSYYHYAYTGEDIVIETNVDDVAAYAVVKNGGNDLIDVPYGDAYDVVAVDLNETAQSHRENYCWTDGSNVESVMFYVIVDPVDYYLPQAVLDATLCATTEYKPDGNFTDYDYDFALTQATQELLENSGVWLVDDYGNPLSSLTYNDDAEYAAGTQTLKYTFQRSNNYKPQTINLSVTVNKAVVEVFDPKWYGTQNVTDPNNWYNTEEGNYIYNELPQRKALEVSTSNVHNYLEQEKLYPKATYKVYYGATENGIDMNNPIQTITVAANEFYGGVLDYEGVGSVNAGYYKTVVTLSVDSDNYVFLDENEQDAGTYELTWQIEKATFTLHPYYTGTFSPITQYSYYTGSNKTIAYDSCSAKIETYYGNDGAQTALFANLWDDDFAIEDYVDDYANIGSTPLTTSFYSGGNWIAAANTSAIGKYKTVLTANLKSGLTANYDLVVEETEWSIYTNAFDAGDMTWNNAGSYAYGTGLPYVENVPEGLLFNVDSYTLAYGDGFQSGHVGSNRRYVTIEANPYADGYEGVTITLPASGWTHGEDGEHNTLNYVADSYADFTVTKRIITIEDFTLQINDKDVTAPYEVNFENGVNYFETLGFDGDMATYGIDVERDDWLTDAYHCYGSESEVGEYVFSGFVWIYGDPNGDYGFDEEADYVRLLTEDYVQGEGENQFVLRVGETVYDNTDHVTDLTYKYVLDFSYPWSLVEAAE